MKNHILTFLFTLLALGCSKDNPAPTDQIPAATQTGTNDAGCYINGQLIVPKNGINPTSGYPVYGLQYFVGVHFGMPLFNDYFALKFENLRSTGKSYWIYIHLNDMTMGTGTYIVGQSNSEVFADGPNNPEIIARETNNGVSGKTYLSGINSGTIIISRFDYPNKIISGIFNATLYNKDNPSETMQVTDGRFDVNLLTINQ